MVRGMESGVVETTPLSGTPRPARRPRAAWLVAAASGAKDVVVALVSNENGKREYPKADVEVTDPMKMNAVHLAALGGFTETIKMLTGPGWGSTPPC